MGRAPPHMIFKRVVKQMMSNLVPGALKEMADAEAELNECWSINGVGSKKCAPQLKVFNEMSELNNKYMKMVANKNYKIHVMKHAAPAVRKYDVKGRHRFEFYVSQKPRFPLVNINLDNQESY
jgi:hypothetical protein